MKSLIIGLLSLFLLHSCTNEIKLAGTWRCSFVDSQFAEESRFILDGFGWYEKGVFEPLVHFLDDGRLRYDLGFRGNDLSFDANYCFFEINDNQLELKAGEREQAYRINSSSEGSFCLFQGKEKKVCFEKQPLEKENPCNDYSLGLELKNEFYEIFLTLSPTGNGQIIRAGTARDTIVFDLDKKDVVYIESLLGVLNAEKFNTENIKPGGDHAAYKIKLDCSGEILEAEFEGFSGLSFELKALVKNIENLIRRQYTKSKK